MPRRNQHLTQSQTQHSQSQRSTQTNLDDYAIETPVNIDDQVNDCVRYILQKAGHKLAFRKSDLQKNVVASSSRNFEAVIQKATQILRNVYGFNLILCDTTSNRAYILSNALPFITDDTEDLMNEPPQDVDKILLLLMLCHIFMSSTPVGEASMNTFLLSLTVNIEKKHPLFGNIKEILNTYTKQKYIHIETDPVSKKASYTWGPRAEKEISKLSVLNFACKIFKDSLPNAWTNQFKMAQEQGFENLPLESSDNHDAMEVDGEE